MELELFIGFISFFFTAVLLVIIFLYQYWGIKDYLTKVSEDKAENTIKGSKKANKKKNK